MDTFAALMLATDPASPALLDRKPDKLTSPLFTVDMHKQLFLQSAYQIVVTLIFHFFGLQILGLEATLTNDSVVQTVVLNIPVFAQIFNSFNSRRLDCKLNIFEGLLKNHYFVVITLIEIVIQLIIVFTGSAALQATHIDGREWGISLTLGVVSILLGALIRLLPNKPFKRLLVFIRLLPSPEALPTIKPDAEWNEATNSSVIFWQRRVPDDRRHHRLGQVGQEVIAIDLDNLDPNLDDVLDLLKEGQCRVSVWAKLAGEYWRRGYLSAAERIAHSAIESLTANGAMAQSPPIYALLANIQIAHAQRAPKDAREDKLMGLRSKEEYYRDAAQYLNAGERAAAEGGEGVGGTLAFLTRGIQQLATRSMDDLMRSFEGVLAEKPTNIVALLGKVRSFARSSLLKLTGFRNTGLHSLRKTGLSSSSQIVPASPPNKPVAKAKAAWQRSLEVNLSEWAAQLLLGSESINASKAGSQTEQERTQAFLVGTKYIEKAFNANQKSAAAANMLCELFLRKKNLKRRSERFADTLTLLTDGNLRAARALHAEGSIKEATKYYTTTMEGQPKHILGAIGMAQMQILNGVSSADVAQEKLKAHELFDRAMKAIKLDDARANGHAIRSSRATTALNDDMEMHVEIARLWQEDNTERTTKAFRDASRVSAASSHAEPRLLNNPGALQHMESNLDEARTTYEDALTKAATLSAEDSEAMSTSILYNLARVYKDSGEHAIAKEVYDKLLSRHPEYVDAKIRQAQMLVNLGQPNDAHELLKQALATQNTSLNLRAFYTSFLLQHNVKGAKDFVFATLKDHERHDVYSLCAAGWIIYAQSQDSRDPNPKMVEERKRNIQRAVKVYHKALQLDPLCAVAAQGLAIAVAEDALGTLSGQLPVSAAEDAQRRLKKFARSA
ncbi:hypothetical protein JVT61DRAFT_12537 [Boletus reticuloceps]|uniref:Cation-transporting P-type ATPase C-terminal domain-containing protein n=1 Tax=Boletus reticuloceps TaxID=495285 RepID=A0A8I2YDX2_9AGAM|nr:hypothetical protein JVT61DRAFT_12537 [Boletus reticuloceps]